MLRPILLAVAALAPCVASLLPQRAAPATVAERLAAAAAGLLATLDDEARSRAVLAFDAEERTNWQFVPGVYPGLPLAALDLGQRRAAHALLRTALGTQGTLKTRAILGLEDVLRARAEAAGQAAAHRDPERYALAVFGDPGRPEPWGFRFQGHHVSLNFTVVDAATVTSTPRFFGANPHEVRSGPYAGTRTLAEEEDGARAFLASLSEAQRQRARVAEEVPADILMGPGRDAEVLGEPVGIPWSALDQEQQIRLAAIVSNCLRDLDPEIARQELARARTAYPGLHFAWIGSTEPGAPHYYRLHAPTFVIEYDNIQDGANHSHTVWHDLRNGFGGDLLRAHLEAAHRRR
jgi:hypothetical protein